MLDNLRSLPGKHLVGPGGESIGRIGDVYESTDGGGGTFATVHTGLFGGSASFFPLREADMTGDDVTVPYTKSFIEDAPRVDNDAELTAQEEAQLFRYYAVGDNARGAGVEVGRAPLRKYVAIEQEQGSVPASHEEVRSVREPITETQTDTGGSYPDGARSGTNQNLRG